VAWGVVPTLRELAPEAKIIYDTVDLHFLRERRRAVVEVDDEATRMAEHYRELELWLANATDATFVVSDVERDLLLQEAPDTRVYVVPTIHRNQQPGGGMLDRDGLLFVGSFNHPPNRDAVEWLTAEILPIVRKSLPEIPMFIVGSNPTEEISRLDGDGIHVLGWVPDLRHLYRRTRLFVAPLRYGAGIRGKIGESAAFGLPVVSTTIGAEGLNLTSGESIVLADTAEDFAAAIVQTYQDQARWPMIASGARRAIALQCSPGMIRHRLAEALEDIGVPLSR
jgi:glycosyltransferase involved in cell wall biosynthesis